MAKNVSNQEVAAILRAIAEYLKMQNVPFKPQAYERASISVDGLDEELKDIYAQGGIKGLKQVEGIGQSMAEHIEELLKTGKSSYYEGLRKEVPVDVAALSRVEGLGPKSIRRLHSELGVKNLEDLEKAAKSGKIRGLRGFGAKAEEKMLKGIDFAKGATVRFQLGKVTSQVESLLARLRKLDTVEKAIAAGSFRRRKETVGDIDLLVVAKDPERVMKHFIETPGVVRVLAEGETKSAVRLVSGLQVDLRVVPKDSYGAALNYFTGSKEHNVTLRQLAVNKGWKLNEYGLFENRVQKGRQKEGERMLAGKNEEELYAKLGLDYIEPELRENTGEIHLSQKHALPKIIQYGSLFGDLQVQTDWTDGASSIEEMAKAAARRGLKYIAITDHTKRLTITNGLDEKRLLQQMAEIDRVNKKLKGQMTVLKGTECDILEDGSLDISDEVLSKLDVVGISVHSKFRLSKGDQTARVLRAMRNSNADILFHPTGRLIGKRDPIELDIDAVIACARETGMVLEANSYPDRLDLKDDHIRKAIEAGVNISIDSDAHKPEDFDLLDYGISQARRGWAEKKDVINAWPLEKMLGRLKRK